MAWMYFYAKQVLQTVAVTLTLLKRETKQYTRTYPINLQYTKLITDNIFYLLKVGIYIHTDIWWNGRIAQMHMTPAWKYAT